MEKIMCSICTDRLFDADFIVSTSCGHVFHEKCLNNWMTRSRTCPECRKDCAVASNRRLYFNSEPIPDYIEKETYQKQIIGLKNDLDTQKKSFEEQLCVEMEIRREMHKENQKLKNKLELLELKRVALTTSIANKDAIIEITDSPTRTPSPHSFK